MVNPRLAGSPGSAWGPAGHLHRRKMQVRFLGPRLGMGLYPWLYEYMGMDQYLLISFLGG